MSIIVKILIAIVVICFLAVLLLRADFPDENDPEICRKYLEEHAKKWKYREMRAEGKPPVAPPLPELQNLDELSDEEIVKLWHRQREINSKYYEEWWFSLSEEMREKWRPPIPRGEFVGKEFVPENEERYRIIEEAEEKMFKKFKERFEKRKDEGLRGGRHG